MIMIMDAVLVHVTRTVRRVRGELLVFWDIVSFSCTLHLHAYIVDGVVVAEHTSEFHLLILQPQQHHITPPACVWPVLQVLESPPINHDEFFNV